MHWPDRLFILPLLARKTKDEDDEWLTSKKKHRFEVEERTGKIVKGFGGTLNGEKLGEKQTSLSPTTTTKNKPNFTPVSLQQYFKTKAKLNKKAQMQHYGTLENIKKAQEAVAKGKAAKSYFTGDYRATLSEINAKLKKGDYEIRRNYKTGECRAVLRFSKTIGCYSGAVEDAVKAGIETDTVCISCNKENGWHAYPIERGYLDGWELVR